MEVPMCPGFALMQAHAVPAGGCWSQGAPDGVARVSRLLAMRAHAVPAGGARS